MKAERIGAALWWSIGLTFVLSVGLYNRELTPADNWNNVKSWVMFWDGDRRHVIHSATWHETNDGATSVLERRQQ